MGVRLGTVVALEVCALGAGVYAAGHGLHRAGAFLLTEARASLRHPLPRASGPRDLALPGPPAPAITDSDERTFMGMSDDVLLDRLRRENIVRIKMNRGGSSISLRFELADGSRCAFKPTQTNPQTVPRKEVAAFRLDRLLGIGHVAPSAPRRLSKDELVEKLDEESKRLLPRILNETVFDASGRTAGEAQYWIPSIKDTELESAAATKIWSEWLSVKAPPPPANRSAVAQHLSTMIVFDLLQNNSDRFSGGNIVAKPDWTYLYFLDNTFGFQVEPGGHLRCRQALVKVQRFSRSLVARLRALDAKTLRDELAREVDPPYEILSAEEIDSVIARTHVALEYIDGLVAQFGADKVLYFP